MTIGELLGSGRKDACFSGDRVYRYTLRRQWNVPIRSHLSMAAFVGLNPSTADEMTDDPTVRRCINYAFDWDYDGMWMLNIFAYRATNPNDLKAQERPAGSENDRAIVDVAKRADLVVCCWGAHGRHQGRGPLVENMLRTAGLSLYHLGTTKHGHPRHPLYLPRDRGPREWSSGHGSQGRGTGSASGHRASDR